MVGLIIEAVAVLNEDNPEFFNKLMKDGVDAVEPEMKKQKEDREEKEADDFFELMHKSSRAGLHREIEKMYNEIKDLKFALHENQDKYAPAISGSNAENDDSSLESRYVSKNPDVKVADHEKAGVKK